MPPGRGKFTTDKILAFRLDPGALHGAENLVVNVPISYSWLIYEVYIAYV
jgi:hypothetical protein